MRCVTAPPSVATPYDDSVRIGVPREVENDERRVALVPDVVARLAAAGFSIAVERGAGERASFVDDAYRESGADLVENGFDADAIVKVRKPSDSEVAKFRDGSILIGFLEPLTDPAGLDRLDTRGVT